jgi:formylglycine-generating enzyme required for sulfatase activity
VIRGGGWDGVDSVVRAANRDNYTPTSHTYYIGIRCVRTP